MYPYRKNLRGTAQALRKDMTDEEKRLWYVFLKKLPFPVKRQYLIENYIVDFYIPAKKTVIEIDGMQHLFEENKKKDEQRDQNLENYGIRVLRYSNTEINQSFESVCEDILRRFDLTAADLKRDNTF